MQCKLKEPFTHEHLMPNTSTAQSLLIRKKYEFKFCVLYVCTARGSQTEIIDFKVNSENSPPLLTNSSSRHNDVLKNIQTRKGYKNIVFFCSTVTKLDKSALKV